MLTCLDLNNKLKSLQQDFSELKSEFAKLSVNSDQNKAELIPIFGELLKNGERLQVGIQELEENLQLPEYLAMLGALSNNSISNGKSIVKMPKRGSMKTKMFSTRKASINARFRKTFWRNSHPTWLG